MKSSIVLGCLTLALFACSKSLTLDDGQSAELRGKANKPDAASAQHDGLDAGTSDPSSSSDDGDQHAQRPAITGPVSPWGGNSAECPKQPVETGDTCSATEGTVCAYTWPDPETATQQRYNECTCRADCGDEPAKRWDCYMVVMGLQAPCPAEQPEKGTSCFGLRGNSCNYPPQVECTCDGDSKSAEWKCGAAKEKGVHPSGIDESTRVGELSADQRQAWCDWLAQREPGYPPWPELDPDSDGFYPNTGCADTGYLSCAVHMPRDYAASACVANLKLSSCEAPLYDLTECVLMMEDRVTEHGCGDYIDVPGCDGTIVFRGRALGVQGPDPNSCRLRVR